MSPQIHAQRQHWFESAFTAGSGIMNTKPRVLGAAALAVAATLLLPAQAFAVEYYLRAEPTTVADPNGGPDIPMWGYALCTGSGAGCGAATVPGPALTVPAGDSVLTVHLANALPPGQPTSLVINGLIKPMTPVWNDGSTGPRGGDLTKRVRSFDTEAATGSSADYTWSNVAPGSYLYQSGTQPQVQVQMGLYGAVAKNAAELGTAAAQAYAGVAYDNQATLLYSEIDPALHAAVQDGSYGTANGPTSTFDYQPKYFLINGKAYPSPDLVILPQGNTGTTLLRFLNAGLTTHVPMIDGTHWTLVAEDGKAYPYKSKQYTALLPAAKTLDVLLTPDAGGAVYAILDRRLNLSNNGFSDGGMMAYLSYRGVGSVGGGSGSGNLPPVAADDSYDSVKGVTLNVGAAAGVLVNDNNTDGLPQPIRAVAATGTTTFGGSFTLNTNGSFSYTPAPGFAGASDGFTYQVTDGLALSAVAGNVTINLSTPVAPSLTTLDDFNRADSTSLGSTWSQVVTSAAAAPNVQVVSNQAKAVTVGLGGLAIWNPVLLETQGAAFQSATALSDSSALVLKATGGTFSAPANYVRVRCEADNVVVSTMLGGSNISIYVTQVTLPSSGGCATPGTLSAVVNSKGIVTTFINGGYIGGVQLPDVSAWKGTGKIGLQMPTQDAIVDDFKGGSL
jgi:FtsP/CotA-like multicopper oxidase with cupredoxin domain